MSDKSIKKPISEKEALLIRLIFAAAVCAVISISTFALGIPVVPAASIAILEVVLINLLDGTPVVTHAIVIVLQAALGFYFGKPGFMILNVLLYLLGLIIFIYADSRE